MAYFCLLLSLPLLSGEGGFSFLLEHWLPSSLDVTFDFINTLFKSYQMGFKVLVIVIGWLIFRSYLSGRGKGAFRLQTTLLVSFLFVCGSFVVTYLNSTLHLIAGSDYLKTLAYSSNPVFEFNDSIVWSSVIESFLVYCFLVPILEEVTYRAIIFNALLSKAPFYVSSVLSSLAFAYVHDDFLPPFILGIVLCFIYVQLGLISVIFVHAIYNSSYLAFHVMYFLSNDSYYFPVYQSEFIPTWDVVGAMVILTFALIYRFSHKLSPFSYRN